MPETPDISRVTSRAGAEDLIGSVLSDMRELEATLGAETAQVRVGRIRDGLASEAKKGELAARYLRGLEAVKANAVALARFAPEAVDGLRAAHASFGRTVEENRIVLATARAVSESRRGSRRRRGSPRSRRNGSRVTKEEVNMLMEDQQDARTAELASELLARRKISQPTGAQFFASAVIATSRSVPVTR